MGLLVRRKSDAPMANSHPGPHSEKFARVLPFQKGIKEGSLGFCLGLPPVIGSAPCQSVSVSVRPLVRLSPFYAQGGGRQRGQRQPGRREVSRPTSGRGHLTAFSTEIEEAGLILKGVPLSTGQRLLSPTRLVPFEGNVGLSPVPGLVPGGNDGTLPITTTGLWVGAPLILYLATTSARPGGRHPLLPWPAKFGITRR